MRLIFAGLALCVLAACSDETSVVELTAVNTPSNTPTPTIKGDLHHAIHLGKMSLEKRITKAEVVARVSLRSYEVVGAQKPGAWRFVPAIRFTFEVHEYLKGSGGESIDVYAYGYKGPEGFSLTENSAEAAKNTWGDWIEGYRDSRFDDRQAIVFLTRPIVNDRYVDYYVIGRVGAYQSTNTGGVYTLRNYLKI